MSHLLYESATLSASFGASSLNQTGAFQVSPAWKDRFILSIQLFGIAVPWDSWSAERKRSFVLTFFRFAVMAQSKQTEIGFFICCSHNIGEPGTSLVLFPPTRGSCELPRNATHEACVVLTYTLVLGYDVWERMIPH